MNEYAMAQAVQKAAKPKFYGQKVLKSKVVTHFPENLAREYMRITNTYMTLLNKTLAEHLPTIRRAIDAEMDGIRRDDSYSVHSVIDRTFMQINADFGKKAATFGLANKLARLSDLTRKLSISEWKRVVHRTLGINVLEDYYNGEFFRDTLRLWTQTNVDLIKTVEDRTLGNMRSIVEDGFRSGKSNTAIGRLIQEEYGMERRHAQFIARDQVAKLNSDLTRSQQEDAGVEEYIWSTSDDARVRERHAELDGTRHKWNDPPIVDERTGRRGHPGQDFNCRCSALPVFNLPGLNLPWEGKEYNANE